LAATARALFGLFSADQVVAFSNAFTRTFIPAMSIVLDFLGRLVHALLAFAGSGPGSVLAQFALVGFGLNKTLTPMVKLFAELGVNVGKILQSKALVGFFGNLLTKLGPIGAAVGIVGGAFLILNSKLHLIDKFKNFFVDAQDRARLAADKFTDSINKQVEALRRQQDAEDRRKGARYALARAEIAVERARQDQDRVNQQIAKGELKGRDADLARREASLGIKQALLDEKQARKDLAGATNDNKKADQGAVNQSKTTLDTARKRIDALKD
jgi:hypothetical protein